MERYKFSLITAAVVILVLIVAYVAWISPEGSKLSTLDTQQTSLMAEQQSLSTEIAHLRAVGSGYVKNCSELERRIGQIPPTVDESGFLDDIDALAKATGTSLPGYSFSLPTVTLPPSSSGASANHSNVSAITVTLNLSGTYGQVSTFLRRLGSLGRLYVVSSYALKSGNASSSGNSSILPTAGSPFMVTLVGSIYYSPTEKDVCTTTTTTG
ncbi:MAG: hypothetical protein ACYDGY_05035 [Acidimicrobiales bacterium]